MCERKRLKFGWLDYVDSGIVAHGIFFAFHSLWFASISSKDSVAGCSHRYLSGPFTDHKLCFDNKCSFSLVNAASTFAYSPISSNNAQTAFSACIIARDYSSATKQSELSAQPNAWPRTAAKSGSFFPLYGPLRRTHAPTRTYLCIRRYTVNMILLG